MKRLTKQGENKKYYIADQTALRLEESGYCGEAIERLARFENIYDNLATEQQKIAGELEKLRSEGKEKSCKFRELLAKKLINSNIMSVFDVYGVK